MGQIKALLSINCVFEYLRSAVVLITISARLLATEKKVNSIYLCGICWMTTSFTCFKQGKNCTRILKTRVQKSTFIFFSSSSSNKYSLFSNNLISETKGFMLSRWSEGTRSKVRKCPIQCISEFRWLGRIIFARILKSKLSNTRRGLPSLFKSCLMSFFKFPPTSSIRLR